MAKRCAVIDTNYLIDLIFMGRLDLPAMVFTAVVLIDQVRDEICVPEQKRIVERAVKLEHLTEYTSLVEEDFIAANTPDKAHLKTVGMTDRLVAVVAMKRKAALLSRDEPMKVVAMQHLGFCERDIIDMGTLLAECVRLGGIEKAWALSSAQKLNETRLKRQYNKIDIPGFLKLRL